MPVRWRTSRGKRVMVFIWGSKDEWECVGLVPVACPSCGRSPCGLYQAKRRFTVYWIPTVTIGSSYAAVCPHCRRQWDIAKDAGDELRLLAQPAPAAGADVPGTPNAGRAAPEECSLVIACPHCGQRNRVQLSRRATATCGRCRRPLDAAV
jgi:hypothetical protein